MINIGRLDERKAYIIIEDYLEIVGDNCCSLYCLSDSTIQMALSSIMVFDWRSRWLTRDGLYIDRVSEEAYQVYRKSFFEKAVRELTMSCDDAIKDGLDGLGDKLLEGLLALAGGFTNANSSNCGCGGNLPNGGNGSGHSGTNQEEPTTNSDNGSGDYPPGFDSYSDYRDYKCAVAAKIVEDYRTDVASMVGLTPILTVLLDVATELALILILDIPMDVLLLIGGVLVAVWAEESGWLENFEDAVTEVEDDLICALFNASDPSGAYSAFKAVINPEIETQVGDPIGDYLIKQLAAYMLTTDELNKLFVKDTSRTYTDHDCSDCGPDTTDYTVILGTETSDHPSNPILGDTVEYVGACDNEWVFQVSFGTPVTITEVKINGAPSSLGGCGKCDGNAIFTYYSDVDALDLIAGGDARPQDDVPVSDVQYFAITMNCDSLATVEINYTVP